MSTDDPLGEVLTTCLCWYWDALMLWLQFCVPGCAGCRYVFDSEEEAEGSSSSARYEVAKSEAQALEQARAK